MRPVPTTVGAEVLPLSFPGQAQDCCEPLATISLSPSQPVRVFVTHHCCEPLVTISVSPSQPVRASVTHMVASSSQQWQVPQVERGRVSSRSPLDGCLQGGGCLQGAHLHQSSRCLMKTRLSQPGLQCLSLRRACLGCCLCTRCTH